MGFGCGRFLRQGGWVVVADWNFGLLKLIKDVERLLFSIVRFARGFDDAQIFRDDLLSFSVFNIDDFDSVSFHDDALLLDGFARGSVHVLISLSGVGSELGVVSSIKSMVFWPRSSVPFADEFFLELLVVFDSSVFLEEVGEEVVLDGSESLEAAGFDLFFFLDFEFIFSGFPDEQLSFDAEDLVGCDFEPRVDHGSIFLLGFGFEVIRFQK